MRWQRWIASTGVAVLMLSVASSQAAAGSAACGPSVTTPVPQPTAAHLAAAGLAGFPLAPEDRRVDVVAPPFTNSTGVTNPLFPISELRSAILNGHVDGKPLKIETTLLPETRIVEWSPGQCVRTLVSQFVAYEGGQIKEVALDHYAQADDGSVWYFGEDVFNYEHGVVADTGGTWLAGKEGPAAMIMPGQPKLGDVNRSENIPGLVFEEVTIKETGRTVNGPRGPLQGAIVGSELHDDGTREDKFFAPGYGEFRSASPSELEAMAVAVPTDASAAPEPAELRDLLDATTGAFRAAGARRWRAASAAVDAISTAWRIARPAGTPPRLIAPLTRALDALDRAVTQPTELQGSQRGPRCRAGHARPQAAIPAAGRDRPRPLRALGAAGAHRRLRAPPVRAQWGCRHTHVDPRPDRTHPRQRRPRPHRPPAHPAGGKRRRPRPARRRPHDHVVAQCRSTGPPGMTGRVCADLPPRLLVDLGRQ